MSIEAERSGLYVPELVVVGAKRLNAAQEFCDLFARIMADSSCLIIPQSGYCAEESRVSFCLDESISLHAKSWTESIEDAGHDPSRIRELSVIDADFEISYKVSEDTLATIDMENDEFLQMILDYFRIQYGECEKL